MEQDAKTDDSIAPHRKQTYERVFSSFATPRFIQSRHEAGAGATQEVAPPNNNDGLVDVQAQAQPTNPLFWVNSDLQTVNGGSRQETLKRIRSHVMSEHNRKKRLENTRRYNRDKTWKNLAFRPESASRLSISSTSNRSSSKASSSSSPEDKEHSFRKGGNIAKPKGVKTAAPARTSSADITRDQRLSATNTQYQDVYRQGPDAYKASPRRVATGDVDPFHAAQVRLSETQYQHLKFCTVFLPRECATLINNQQLTQKYAVLYDLIPQAAPFIYHGISKLRSHWVTLVQSNPSALYACITSAATNKALMTGDFFADPDTQRSSPLILDRLRSRGETIGLINRDLSSVSSASSDASIAAVSVLISIEITGSNPQDIAIHLNGLRKMVSLRKNFSDIAKNVRWQLEWTDIRSACKTMSKPLFPFIRYTMPSHTPSEVLVSNAGKLGSSLLALNHSHPGTLSSTMTDTINDLISVTLYAEIFKTNPKLAAVIFDEEIEDYFNNEVLYTEYSLLNDRYITPTILRDANDNTPEAATRIASLLFHNTALWPFYPSIAPVFPMPVFALQSSIASGLEAGYYHNDATAPATTELLIWLLFVGACASKYLPPIRAFFMQELGVVLRRHCVSCSPASSSPSTPSPRSSSSSSSSPSSSSSAAFSSSSGIRTFDDFRDLLQGYLYVDRCYLVEARDVIQFIS
ncbi:hypothetical protein UA08_08174 [Talaromyces atroroseus]|uniref:Uncharacterized protein n=1 Tax=Talaromyces atroroseus TaxID=1441469 RepID=A0A225AM07_TALAT|nr:hypothetical protein UA08_08174 [Talaromyces atroroseus]OKL56599.1 hypothetical protein UA08_08174 [Talaromyces atroroseus]